MKLPNYVAIVAEFAFRLFLVALSTEVLPINHRLAGASPPCVGPQVANIQTSTRALCNGKTLAFQAKDAGSIPAARSNLLSQLLPRFPSEPNCDAGEQRG